MRKSSDVEEVLDLWFGGEPVFRERWFRKDPAFDAEIRNRFGGLYERAARGELEGWKEEPRSCLALILLLDQFPRNMFRGTARAFATDGKAREAADSALRSGFDRALSPVERLFVYLPFEHSERLEDQRRSVELFGRLAAETGLDQPLEYAERHMEIIERFGRFPHRNEALGRKTTEEETAFLKTPGSSF
ncbi:membrane protein [Rubrobacter xylanophilus]|uniref:Membrane protein n=1 Tax=Rubrobacter xylanophilus TaxID=49319 RepID=A0A510HEZ4_9ACTN|nr:DUF924 family protein [Rubrobacter xylanophilus]BBL78506.1 membrane protein [Rubrobacter xylanophilus]